MSGTSSKDDPLAALDGREVIYEFIPLAGFVKVTAVDGETGIEVSVMAPTRASQSDMERVVARKLVYRLRREGRLGAPRRGVIV